MAGPDRCLQVEERLSLPLNTLREGEGMGHQLIWYSIQYTTTPVTET